MNKIINKEANYKFRGIKAENLNLNSQKIKLATAQKKKQTKTTTRENS